MEEEKCFGVKRLVCSVNTHMFSCFHQTRLPSAPSVIFSPWFMNHKVFLSLLLSVVVLKEILCFESTETDDAYRAALAAEA